MAVGIDQATALINEKDHWTDGEQSKLLHRVDFLISMARELEIGPRHGRSLQMKNIFFGELESRLRTEKRKVIVSIKSGNGHYHITEKGDIGGDGLDIQVEGEIYKIPTGLIDPDPEQPREYFDPAQMAETKNSINLMGQQQAGQVFKLPNGRYKLIDGERRFRICRELDIPSLKRR